MGIKEDHEMPLKELYCSLPESTQKWIDSQVRKIWMYFIFWCAFSIGSVLAIIFLINLNPVNEPLGVWFQRSGSIITLVASFSEAIFVVKLNKLVRISHWAQLSAEIYVERAYKKLLNFSLLITAIFIALGTLIWGYGDILFSHSF